MPAWECPGCATAYAVALFRCPRCHWTREEGEDMPKITAGGGPSHAAAEPGQPGYIAPADDDAAPVPDVGEPGTVGPGPDPEEEPSPGSSSSTSDETPTSRPDSNETSDPRPARTTGSPSPKAPEAPSGAGSTAGAGRRTGSRRGGGA